MWINQKRSLFWAPCFKRSIMALLITYRKTGLSDPVLGNGLSRFKTHKYKWNAMVHGYRVWDMAECFGGRVRLVPTVTFTATLGSCTDMLRASSRVHSPHRRRPKRDDSSPKSFCMGGHTQPPTTLPFAAKFASSSYCNCLQWKLAVVLVQSCFDISLFSRVVNSFTYLA